MHTINIDWLVNVLNDIIIGLDHVITIEYKVNISENVYNFFFSFFWSVHFLEIDSLGK